MTDGETFLTAPPGSPGRKQHLCLLLAPPGQGAPAQQRPEPARHSSALGLGSEGAARSELLGEPSREPSEQRLEEEGEGGPTGQPQGQEEGHEGAGHLPLVWQHLPGTHRGGSS